MSPLAYKSELLGDRFCDDDVIRQAWDVLHRDEQTEEAFLGAQGVLMLCGLL
jgi:hypothetical protein